MGPPINRGEAEFFGAIAQKTDQAFYSMEITASEISDLTNRSFRIFECIVCNFGKKKGLSDFQTIELALHEYMFKTLYHLNLNCRKLVYAQAGGPNQLNVYLKGLKKKFDLADEQLAIIGQNWFENENKIWEALTLREYRIKVYDDGGCFQIYDNNLDQVLKIPQGTGTSNGLIISKYYFVSHLFRIFQHLQICTQILQMTKTGDADDADTDIVDYVSMNAFIKSAGELFNRDV